MAKDQTHFKVGFRGAASDEAVDKINSLINPEKVIVVPFAGSGKYIAAFAREDRTIYSWDTQEVSRVLIEALATPWKSNIDSLRGLKGYARDEFPFQGLDEGTARFLNYVAIRGSDHDKMGLIKMIIRSTVMGRLGQWSASINGYEHAYDIFLRARESLKPWAGRPGIIRHTKGDFFQASVPSTCDLLYIDPPKIFGKTDVYSGKPFRVLNGILEQTETDKQPKWTIDTYIQRIKDVINCSTWNIAVLFHSSGIVPTIEELIALFPADRKKELLEFPHGNILDYAIVVR